MKIAGYKCNYNEYSACYIRKTGKSEFVKDSDELITDFGSKLFSVIKLSQGEQK